MRVRCIAKSAMRAVARRKIFPEERVASKLCMFATLRAVVFRSLHGVGVVCACVCVCEWVTTSEASIRPHKCKQQGLRRGEPSERSCSSYCILVLHSRWSTCNPNFFQLLTAGRDYCVQQVTSDSSDFVCGVNCNIVFFTW